MDTQTDRQVDSNLLLCMCICCFEWHIIILAIIIPFGVILYCGVYVYMVVYGRVVLSIYVYYQCFKLGVSWKEWIRIRIRITIGFWCLRSIYFYAVFVPCGILITMIVIVFNFDSRIFNPENRSKYMKCFEDINLQESLIWFHSLCTLFIHSKCAKQTFRDMQIHQQYIIHLVFISDKEHE